MNGVERKRGVRGGRPIVQGAGIETNDILQRFLAGESMSDIAHDFDMGEAAVEAAIRFECCRACKCKECAWARKLKVTR